MKTKKTILIGALLGTMLATPVLAAADGACLQQSRVWGWRAVNERTLVVTDQSYKRYTVHMRSGCTGLTNAAATLVFKSWSNLACIGSGDFVGVESPGLGFVRCAITGVDGGAPAAAAPAPG